MSYPDTPNALRTELSVLAFLSGAPLGASVHEALATAASHPSIVLQADGAIRALAPLFEAQGDGLAEAARSVLAGALKLTIEQGWMTDVRPFDYPAIFASVSATLASTPEGEAV